MSSWAYYALKHFNFADVKFSYFKTLKGYAKLLLVVVKVEGGGRGVLCIVAKFVIIYSGFKAQLFGFFLNTKVF